MSLLFDLVNKMEIRVESRWQSFQQKRCDFKTNIPYISGDVFASTCDLRIDGLTMNAKEIETARSVFIKGDFLEHHLRANAKLLANKVVVSGNSDKNFDSPPKGYTFLKALFAQNLVVRSEERVFAIPIGIENLSLHGSGKPHYHRKVSNFEFEEKVLIPPMGQSNVQRLKIFDLMQQNRSIFDYYTDRLSRRRYFKLTSRYKYVLVLEGNGYDTHRLWEVLYQGSFPVVLKSPWIDSLDYLKLPILKVSNINMIDELLLRDFSEKHANFDPELKEELWAPFWKLKITEMFHQGDVAPDNESDYGI